MVAICGGGGGSGWVWLFGGVARGGWVGWLYGKGMTEVEKE